MANCGGEAVFAWYRVLVIAATARAVLAAGITPHQVAIPSQKAAS